ncbi:MAG: amino acid transporter substrate-binding protein [Ramlibacter sp.]|nr:amino acid transporter substrate-binding protein [Ramlibacter sp.]
MRSQATLALALTLAAAFAGSARAQAPAAPATTSPTLAAVKARGVLNCGVIGSSANFSLPDSQGVMRGIDADSCRSVAAAVFGDAGKVKFVSLAPAQRLPAVQSGEVDVAYANITWTMTRETKSGIQFTNVNFYDTWGFLVPKAAKVTSTARLNGASVCMISGPGESNAAEYFGKLKVRYKAVPFAEGEQMRKAFLARRCDVMFHDAAAIASFTSTLGAQAADYVMLAETHGREPLAGAVRKGDERWFDIVRYTSNAMVAAEELGISSKNVKTFAGSTDAPVKRLLGIDGDLGPSMGLDKEWAANVIAQVGNYGEMWERAFSASGMPRAANRLAAQGGLLYAVPMQ